MTLTCNASVPCGRAPVRSAFGAAVITLLFLGTLGDTAFTARGQEPASPEAVETVTEAENVPLEAEQAPRDARPLPPPSEDGVAGRPAPSEPLLPPTTAEGTTAAAMTAPPPRVDFRRFGVRFAEPKTANVNPTPADQASAAALTVSTVRRPSAASQLGLQPDDQIVSVGGQPVTSGRQIGEAIEKALDTGPRDDHVAIPLVVRRDGAEQQLIISNAELTIAGYGPLLTEFGHYVPPQYVTGYRGEADTPHIPANPTGAYLGVELNSQYRNAAIVSRVLPGTPAAQAGLEEGDRIFALNNRSVESPDELIYWVGQMQPGDTIEISFERAHDVEVTLGTRSSAASERASGSARPTQSE